MKVLIADHAYKMTYKQKKSVLSIASRMIKKGIYAVEKQGVCELKKEKYTTDEDLRKAVKDYEDNGFKVHFNE